MPFERRLRDELNQAAAPVNPDTERSLFTVLGRRRRRARMRRVILALAATGLAAAIPFTGARIIDSTRPADDPPTVAAARQRVGAYQVTLTQADSAGIEPSLAGTWRMRLKADGAIVLTAPAAFTAEGSAAGEVFTADQTTFRTSALYNAFCTSIGAYTWRLSGAELSLVVGNDPCEIRRALLSIKPWTRTD
jgi:hypothetical protein